MAQSKTFRSIASSTFARDPAVCEATVTLDTSQWSTRKKNIVLRALQSGIVSAGWDTTGMIRELTQAMGAEIPSVDSWNASVRTEFVKPELLDELLSYTAARIKLRGQMQDNPYTYNGDYWFMDSVENGKKITQIPLDQSLSQKERTEFIAKYIREPSEQEAESRLALIKRIEDGDKITLKHAA